jgi:hypothetical protein
LTSDTGTDFGHVAAGQHCPATGPRATYDPSVLVGHSQHTPCV